jgi:putative addiction module killer protein
MASLPNSSVEAKPRKIEIYVAANGKSPFEIWMEGLKKRQVHGIIINRMERAKKGLVGDTGPVGNGVHEFRIDFGGGYRVYFGYDGDKLVLLCGGTKKSQSRDIATAKSYWGDYNA